MSRQFTKFVVNAPPGKLGIHLMDNIDRDGASISEVNDGSPLSGTVFPGDKIVGINDVDCSRMDTIAILDVFKQRSNMNKTMEFQRAVPVNTSSNSSSVITPVSTMPDDSSNDKSTKATESSSSTEKSKRRHGHRHRKHHGHSKKKHRIYVDESQESGPPLPVEMVFDDSIAKESGRKKLDLGNTSVETCPENVSTFDESMMKKHQPISIMKPNLDPPDEETGPPLPPSMAFMQFDDSLAKSSRQKSHCAIAVEQDGGSNEAPVPLAMMQFDDSLAKDKVKAANSNAMTATNNEEVGELHNHKTMNNNESTEEETPPSYIEEAPQGDEISAISLSTTRPSYHLRSQPDHRPISIVENENQGGMSGQSNEEYASMNSSSGDIEEGGMNIENDILANAVLVDDQEVYDAECVTNEQASSANEQSTAQQHVTINQNLMAPASVQEEHPKARTTHFWESRCFVFSIVLIVLIIAGSVIGGIVAYLQGKNNNEHGTLPSQNDPILPTTYINTPITVDISFHQGEEDGSVFEVKNITEDASNGACTVDEDGDSITYTPDVGFVGTDQCTYIVCDKEGCDEASVEVKVTEDIEEINSTPTSSVSSTLPTKESTTTTSTSTPTTTTELITTTTTTSSSSTTTEEPTTTTTIDNTLFYVDWNAGLFGMCVQNCVGPSPCGGIDQWEEKFTSAQQCCEEQFPSMLPSECTDADVSDWAPTTTTTTTTTTSSSSTITEEPTTTTTIDNTLFYVDWNAGLFGMCVQNCVGPSPCGGIDQWEEKFTSVQQCCEEQLPSMLPSECTDADVSDWGPTTTFTTTTSMPFSKTPPIMITGNDKCVDAQVIADLPVVHSGNTAGATPDFDSALDDTCGVSLASRGVWYTLNSTTRRIVRLEYQLFLFANQGNSELSVFTGPCEKLECLKNIEGADHASYHTEVMNELVVHEFLADEGETYYFLLSGELESTVGEYQLTVSEYQVPPNDSCEGATSIDILPTTSKTFKGSTREATPDFDRLSTDTCGVNWYTRGVWYKLEGRGTVVRLEYQLNSMADNGDSQLSIFTGSSCSSLDHQEELDCVTHVSGADHASYHPTVPNELAIHEFLANEGNIYWFLLTGDRFDTVADYEFKVSYYMLPVNDSCEGATSIDTLPKKFKDLGSTLGATPDFDKLSIDTCGVNWYTRGVWYKLEGRGTVVRLEYQLNSMADNGDSQLSIFTGSSCSSLDHQEELDCVTHVSGADHASYHPTVPNELAIHEFLANEGDIYWFLLTGERFSTAAEYDFLASEYAIPTNDSCDVATPISTDILTYTIPGTTAGARPDFNRFSDYTCGGTYDSRGVWYSLIGNGKLTTISYTNILSKNSQMSLFSGSCNVLFCEVNAESTGFVQFVPDSGKEYRLLLSGNSFSAVGDYTLTVKQYDPPDNDACNNAIQMANFPFTYTGDLKGATPDFNADNVQCGGDSTLGGAWFTFLGTGSGVTFELKTVGTDGYFQSEISVFRGPCNTFECTNIGQGSGETAVATVDASTMAGVQYHVLVSATQHPYEEIQYRFTVSALQLVDTTNQ